MKRMTKLLLVTLSALFLLPLSASADVNDFSFESFDAKYEISINEQEGNRPEMVVTETLVALFPDFDQNRGIRRDIPSSSYAEFPGLVKIISVTDENGMAREYEQTNDGDFVSLAIKASDDSYVYGRQTYVIKYSQVWVLKNYQDSSGFDEFYWDVNGTGWQQSFGRVSASITLDEELSAALSSANASCYQGLAGERGSCDAKEVTADKITFSATDLSATATLTVVLPFTAGVGNTSGPQVSGTLPMNMWWLALALVVAVLLWAIYFRFFLIRNQGKKAFIVPIYKPTEQPGLLTSALVSGKQGHLIQALIVERAVQGELEIQLGTKKDNFVLRRTQSAKDSTGLLQLLGLAKAGDQVVVGPSAKDKALNKMSEAIELHVSNQRKLVSSSGYFLKRALGLPAIVFLAAVVIYAIWLVLSLMLDSVTDAGFVAAPLISFGPFALVYWLLVSKRAYSAKGMEVISTLAGLEMYIDLAEKDRLEFLQSPKGASLKPSELKGKQVLKLYEEVLPWAILLGLQQQWGKVLTDLYAQTATPIWFVGTPQLTKGLDSLNSALSASLATSSTGGSSGGGSSGGGGGGGGGGGI